MSSVMNAILVSFGMIFLFFLFFLLIYILAISLFPVEKGLSKMIWDATSPPPPKIKPKSSFKDFSTKH